MSSLLPILLPVLIGLVGGLAGVALGAWLIQRRERLQRQLAFAERQLREFYSPMWGLRREIEMRSRLRVRIQGAAEAAWRDLTDRVPVEDPDAARQLDERRWPAFERLIEDDTTIFKEDLLPAYRRMAALFRENLWLSDTDTQAYYPEFMEYLELWERHLRGALPGEVLTALGHTEQRLHPFYAHIHSRHDALRRAIQLADHRALPKPTPTTKATHEFPEALPEAQTPDAE